MSPSNELAVPRTYAALRKAVEVAMIQGQQAVEMARVRTYHETGRLIQEHLLLFRERADYGTKTVRRLAADIRVDSSVLYRCLGFRRAFPIVATWPQLTWGHYRVLIPVADPKQRRALATEANQNQWSVVQLEQRIRSLAPPDDVATPATTDAQPRLTPKRGIPGVCRVIADGEGLAVDLGFACYLRLPPTTDLGLNEFVKVTKSGVSQVEGVTKAALFTYRAEVLKVVDGDTLWVRVFLRPDQWVKQKLRLRDLDCPEMSTPEGKAAKRFVDALIARSSAITICTSKPDKYDRYLADVFIDTNEGEVYLNNELLGNGYAVIKQAWEFADWNDSDNR